MTSILHEGQTLECSPVMAAAFQALQRRNQVLEEAGRGLLAEAERLAAMLFFSAPRMHRGNPHFNLMRDSLRQAGSLVRPTEEETQMGFEFWWDMSRGHFPERGLDGRYRSTEAQSAWRAWRHLSGALGLTARDWADLRATATKGAIDSARLDAIESWGGVHLFQADEEDWHGEVGLPETGEEAEAFDSAEAMGCSLRDLIDRLQTLTPAGAMARA